MNSVIHILFVSFLLSQALTIVNARPLNVNLSPSVTNNDNVELIPNKARFEERERREFHLKAGMPYLEPHLKRMKRGRRDVHLKANMPHLEPHLK